MAACDAQLRINDKPPQSLEFVGEETVKVRLAEVMTVTDVRLRSSIPFSNAFRSETKPKLHPFASESPF